MANEVARNPGLLNVHRILCWVYAICAVWLAFEGLTHLGDNSGARKDVILAVLVIPLVALHWYAAEGARLGKTYGRTISQIMGVILLFAFPVFTAVGIYMLSRTGGKWHDAPAAPEAQ